MKLRRILGVAAVLASCGLGSAGAQRVTKPGLGTIRLVAGVVTQANEVRPIPLTPFDLVPVAGTSYSDTTSLDGHAEFQVAPGGYQLRSRHPTLIEGRKYSWDLLVKVAAGQTLSVELSNLNAAIDSSAQPVPDRSLSSGTETGQRAVAPEAQLFERVKRGVVRVVAGLGWGSGFFADTLGKGVIITNDHVVEAGNPTVMVDSVTRVPAQILARDHDADIAILRIDPNMCGDCPRLRLLAPAAGAPVAEDGERVIAIGFPLHQERTLTTGIVSSLRDRAVISDVNINHGNSGGPMLVMSGDVLAINTFGDFTTQGGPGISGAILASQANGALQAARVAMIGLPPPGDARLPTMPLFGIPVAEINAIADTVNSKTYRSFNIDASRFQLTLATPISNAVAQRVVEQIVAKDRKKREGAAGLGESEQYSVRKEVRDWGEYVGEGTRPVVTVTINPKLGETTGSLFRRILVASAGAQSQATVRYKGDVRNVTVYRNGAPVETIMSGHSPQTVLQEDTWVSAKDVADMGYVILQVRVFEPDSAGHPPAIAIEIEDLKNPGDPTCVAIKTEVVARIWNDFAPIAEKLGISFVIADPSYVAKRGPDRAQVCHGQAPDAQAMRSPYSH
jgi:S1-C subfamily serine protease